MFRRCVMSGFVLLLATGMTGCLRTTHLVQKAQAPGTYKTASIDELEKQVSDRDAAVRTLRLQVLVTASTGGAKEGKVTEYISFKGYIFIQKPSSVRVILQLPVVQSRALDVVGDADTFTLVHATAGHGDVWMQGSNTVTNPSKNGLENLRPPIFTDSLLVRGVQPDEYVSLIESLRLIEPANKHQDAIEEPDYDLTTSKIVRDHILQP